MYAAEKGIALTIVEVDIATGATQAPAYRTVNPLGELPTLELDDGTRIPESLAICRYLDELQPEPNLFGRSPLERATVNSWIDRLMFRAYLPTTHVFRHAHPFWASRLRQIPEWAELQREAVLAEFDALDALLVTQAFVAGERFTMADIVAFTTVDFGRPSQLRVDATRPALLRWYTALGARPSARA